MNIAYNVFIVAFISIGSSVIAGGLIMFLTDSEDLGGPTATIVFVVSMMLLVGTYTIEPVVNDSPIVIVSVSDSEATANGQKIKIKRTNTTEPKLWVESLAGGDTLWLELPLLFEIPDGGFTYGGN